MPLAEQGELDFTTYYTKELLNELIRHMDIDCANAVSPT